MEKEEKIKTRNGKVVTVAWKQAITKNKRNAFFYGGPILTTSWKNPDTGIEGIISLIANGEVRGSLYTADQSEELTRFKDKDNEGDRDDVEHWIRTDKQLEKALQIKGDVSDDVILYLDQNNWLEWFFDRKDENGNITTDYFESVVDDSNFIPNEAELSDRLDDWLNELTERKE